MDFEQPKTASETQFVIVTALYTYYLDEISKSNYSDKTKKCDKQSTIALLAGVGSWLEVYLPLSKVNR